MQLGRSRFRSRMRASSTGITLQREILTRSGDYIQTRDGSLVIARAA
jgi:hypothetical protein